MLIRITMLLLCSYGYISCSTKHNKITKTNNVAQVGDSLAAINTLVAQLYHTSSDTNTFKKVYDSTYLKLYYLEDAHTITPKCMVHYITKLNVVLDTLTKYNYLQLYKYKKAKNMAMMLYLHGTASNYNAVIQCKNAILADTLHTYLRPPQYVNMMHDVGIAYNTTGDLLKTKEVYTNTIQYAYRNALYNDVAKATVNLNTIYAQENEYDSILYNSNHVLHYNIDNIYKASLALNMATAYLMKHQVANATMRNNNAYTYLQATDTSNRPADYYNRLSAVYMNKANIAVQKNELLAADNHYNNALLYKKTFTHNKGRTMAKLYIEIAQYITQHNQSTIPLKPLQFYNMALQALEPNVAHYDALPTINLQYITAENCYIDIADAVADYITPSNVLAYDTATCTQLLKYYDAAFKTEQLLLNNFVYDTEKIDFIENSKARTNKALKLCYYMYTVSKDVLWANKAFQYIENNKAIVLLQKIQHSNSLQKLMQNDTLISQLNYAKKTLETLQIEKNKYATIPSNIATDMANAQLRVDNIQSAITVKYPQTSQLFAFNTNYTIAKVQANVLQKDVALIQYFIQDSTLYTIAITANAYSFDSKIINRTLLNTYISNCSNLAYQQQHAQAFICQSNEVYSKVFPAILNNYNCTQLIILKDGVLQNLCFESLITTLKPTYNYATQYYVVNKYAINYGYSYALIMQKNKAQTNDVNILALAPAYNHSIANLPTLPYTLNEVNGIQLTHTNTAVILGRAATKSNFMAKYNSYNILHIATHSMADSVLGNAALYLYDQPIYANELYVIDPIQAQLVYLSGCETTLGKQYSSEGNISLARSIYYAGANYVIASLWIMNDKSSSSIVQNFYTSVANNNYQTNYAKDLQYAKQTYLTQASPEVAMPYYWAGYTITGYTTPIHSSWFRWYYMLILVIPIFYLFVVKRHSLV